MKRSSKLGTRSRANAVCSKINQTYEGVEVLRCEVLNEAKGYGDITLWASKGYPQLGARLVQQSKMKRTLHESIEKEKVKLKMKAIFFGCLQRRLSRH